MAEPIFAQEPLTVAAFHLWQEGQTERFELVGGAPLRMMTGARQQHDAIVLNILAALRQRLRGKPCRPFTQDIAVAIPNGNRRRPDAGVMCGRFEPDSFEASEPSIVIDVLSPSTSDFDAFRKLEEYKQVVTLRAILLVDPSSPAVNVYLHPASRGEWRATFQDGLDRVIALDAIGIELPLAEIYEGLPLPTRPTLVQRPDTPQ